MDTSALPIKSIEEYENQSVLYNYNGALVDLHGQNGIIAENGNALAPLDSLFVEALGLSCSLRLKDSSVTLSNGTEYVTLADQNHSLILNGAYKEISDAPVLLRMPGGDMKLFAPSRTLLEALGYDYEWNKTLSTAFIERSLTMDFNSEWTESPIEIPLFGEDARKVRIEDRYYDKEFVIYLPGDHTKELEANPIKNRYAAISGIDLELTAKKETAILFHTNKIVASQFEVKNNTIYLSVLKPRDCYKKIVVIDPGHGGYDPGAIRDKTNESDLNLSIAYENTKDLFEASDIKVYYTRVRDVFVSLDKRAAFASSVGADFFVSLHQNTFQTSAMKGTSVYYSSDNKNKTTSGLSGKLMAGILAEKISNDLSLTNLGRLNQRMSVTTYNTVPAALVEMAFLSNPDELTKLQDPAFRKKAGQALFDAIVEIFEQYPTNR